MAHAIEMGQAFEATERPWYESLDADMAFAEKVVRDRFGPGDVQVHAVGLMTFRVNVRHPATRRIVESAYVRVSVGGAGRNFFVQTCEHHTY